MTKWRTKLIFLFFLCLPVTALYAEKFTSSFSSGSLTQENQESFKNKAPIIPSMPAPSTVSMPTQPMTPEPQTPASSTPVIPEPQTTDGNLIPPATHQPNTQISSVPSYLTTSSSLDTLSPNLGTPLSAPAIPPTLKSPYDLKQTKISVPNYEQKFNAMLAAEQMAKEKKKKSLLQSLLDEIMNYSVFIVLGLVALVVVYTMRKDKVSGTDKDEEQIKKDIWHEEF